MASTRTRWPAAVSVAVALVAVAVPATSPAQAAGQSGEAIIHCDLASAIAYPVDPILKRTGPSAHNHIFFGNTNLPPAAAQALRTGNFTGLSDTSLEPTSTNATTCRNGSDGSGMWFPELFWNGAPRTADGFGHSIYLRAYYVTNPTQTPGATDIPDVLQEVNGYPTATAPPAVTSRSTYQAYTQNIYWDCGQAGNAAPKSPRSPWPYSCDLWNQSTAGPPSDGLVGHVNFPTCLDANGAGYDNLDGGPFYAPAGLSTRTNNLAFPGPAGCPAGWVQLPEISIRLHTLLEGATTQDQRVVAPGSTWSGLPSCFSDHLSGNCTNTTPQASDLALGFVSDRDPTGQTCAVPVQATCGYYSYHGDYMQMWRQVAPSSLDTHRGADPAASYLTLEDVEEDCLLAAEAHLCGFVPTHSSLTGV